ncbi:MAG: S8 family peptidase [Kouleothrix sp.]|jgi:serine protease AprX|nr:S8 family peptidase [Kouleothrix sp.]
MLDDTTHTMRRSNVININRLLIAFALVAAVLAHVPALPRVAGPLRADSTLLAMATRQPASRVSVIVRTLVADQSAERWVAERGGTVTSNLPIINGFAAELPAQQITGLARLASVAWVSRDAPVESAVCSSCVSAANLVNNYIYAIHANQVWAGGLQGQGIGVAVVDSGINLKNDLLAPSGVSRVVANVAFHNGLNQTTSDGYGHGTHIAGIIGGNGYASNGQYIGVAPRVNLINVKVSDDRNEGVGTAKSVVQGLQWILQHKTIYNIRVVNISINSAEAESYHTNPIDAAAEILWINGIVVVTSAGNRGADAIYPPANDPFVITVGATDDRDTATLADDRVASFSAYGRTSDGFDKPDLVAPGKNIVSLLGGRQRGMPAHHPGNIVSRVYFRMSGTSVSAPMVAAAAALLLQDEPALTPDQVKYRLMATANTGWAGYSRHSAGAGYLDIYAAVNGSTTASANTNIPISRALWGDANTDNGFNWNSVNWNSVNWNSVNWNSVNWNSVNWNSDYWGE